MGQQQWTTGGEQGTPSNLAKVQRDTTDLGALSRSAAKKPVLPSRPIGKPIGLVKGGRSMSKG